MNSPMKKHINLDIKIRIKFYESYATITIGSNLFM